ncbi:Initiator Replication protein (plasmid) [Vibrio sp. B1REV9]|nr:Initiator Replication protein [Vibrio sp. B1REV9]
MFKQSEDGLGIKLHKHGRHIYAIEFLYHWITDSQPIEQMCFEDAKRTITKIETKRLTTEIALTDDELILLAHSYRSINEEERAQAVDKALAERAQAVEIQDAEDKSFLDKLVELEKMNGMKSY